VSEKRHVAERLSGFTNAEPKRNVKIDTSIMLSSVLHVAAISSSSSSGPGYFLLFFFQVLNNAK
jgi:hypothetical protein